MDRLAARFEKDSATFTDDDNLSDSSASSAEWTQFSHDLVLVDEFDAL